MIKFTAQEQKQLDKLKKGLNRNTRVDQTASILSYIKKYASSGKMVKGRWRRWDSRTKKWYNSKDATAYLNKQKYGTATPREDLKYLQALKLQSIREAGTQYNDPTRVKLSRKLVIDETNPYGTVYEKEQAARMNKDRAKLTQLRKKSSYVERDFGSDYAEKEKALFIAAGDEEQIPGSGANESLKIENKNNKGKVQAPNLVAGESSENNNKVQASIAETNKVISNYGRLMLNPGGLVGRDADVRRSDGRSTALSIAQEDFMGIKKGEQLGVLTRAQRRRYDRDVLKIGG